MRWTAVIYYKTKFVNLIEHDQFYLPIENHSNVEYSKAFK